MKRSYVPIKLTLLSLLLSLAAPTAKGKGYPCDSFCVKSIKIDSANSKMLDVIIYNSSSVFIDYPTVRVISNKDTVGNKRGTVEYYGQLGKTTLKYTMETTLDSVPSNFTCLVMVTSPTGSKGDTCFLTYPCSTATGVQDALKQEFSFSLFPDPATSTLSIESEEATGPLQVRVYTLTGKELMSESFAGNGKLFSVNVMQLPAGMYLLSVKGNNSAFTGKFIKD